MLLLGLLLCVTCWSNEGTVQLTIIFAFRAMAHSDGYRHGDEVLVDVLLGENQQSTLFGLGITRQLHQIVFGNVNWLNVTILSKKM
ncbi:hypothetical protein BJN45_13110 [Azonexus hydrophilus]|uniref:Uncharacterized protein n=1 Tax=Azonexus hydrophilus TaxID=418702 RepID=A0A1R1I333_9RHOO|nr:hypothetical protein BJN45_13110 [Azonexus hydrophilus]